MPWLDTGIESLNSSDVPWLDTGIESSNSSDVSWLDTGVESGNSVVDLLNTFDIRMPQVVVWNLELDYSAY